MNSTLKLLLSMSASGSIIAIILFAIKPVTRKLFSKSWQYYIWLIVVFRLLIPYSPQVNIMDKIYNGIDSLPITMTIENIVTNENHIMIESNNNQKYIKEKKIGTTMDLMKLITDNFILIWILVSIILFIRKITAYQSFIRYVKAGRKLVRNSDTLTLFSSSCHKRDIKVPPQLYTNNIISSPMLVGVLKPFIVIPEAEISDKHLQYIFLHELTHLKKLDIVYKWLVQLIVSIHWFNPIVYFMSKEINKTCEFSCDESVLALLNEKNKRAYGDTILSSLEIMGTYKSEIISMTLCEDAAFLKSRLKAIANFTRKSKSTTLASIILASMFIFSSLWFGIHPISSAQQENTTYSKETITKADVDVCALEIMQRTGNWRYVEPLFPYMTSTGVENVTKLYIQKTGNYEQPKMVTEYINKDDKVKIVESSQTINKTYKALAYELIDKTNDLYSSIVIFEFMDKKEIDDLVIEYMSKTNEIYKLYEIYPLMSTNAIDKIIIDYVDNTGDTDSVKGLIPFMNKNTAKNIFK